MFKSLQIYRLPTPWDMQQDTLVEHLSAHAFQACSSMDKESRGWISPRQNGQLVHSVNKQLLIQLRTETKLLPAKVIKQFAKEKADEIAEQQGFKPGRKQMREIKEQVTDELLPRAFSLQSDTSAWIDPVNGWLVIDAATPSKADDLLKLLLKSVDQLPLHGLRVKQSPITAMTDWLSSDEAPAGFTIDQDTELRSSGEGKATVRYVRHTLEAADIGRHISAGKQCTRLAMTWKDRISFVLTENLTIKRVEALDILKESTNSTAENDDERFDSDFMLMTGELQQLLPDLLEALGGEDAAQTGSVQESTKVPVKAAYGVSAVSEDADALYDEAVKLVRKQNKASISMVQRHLRLGYNRSARLVEEMETKGVVSAEQNGTRTVLAIAPAARSGQAHTGGSL